MASTLQYSPAQDLPAAPSPTTQIQGQTGVAGLPPQPLKSAEEAQAAASNPNGFTWAQIKQKFLAQNPSLQADALNVQESKAQEITAFLRPNPTASLGVDQLYPFSTDPYRPFANALVEGSISYLHEREHKRELRRDAAVAGTDVAQSQHQDLERTLLSNLRTQFVDTLQAKAVLALTREELDYYDHLINISRWRYQKGDIAQIDFDRIELQRVQYESDLETATVNLRQAKIVLLQLLNDKAPVEGFDIQGEFDYKEQLGPLETFQQIALETRPDLRAAMQSIKQADINHKLAIANGSADPTFSVDAGSNPPLSPYVGFAVDIPVRIFDRNQGEKLRTQVDIAKNQRQQEVVNAQVFSDVNSAYVQVESTLRLLHHYKEQYLAQATRVRDTVTYAYQRGGVSLLDLLNAQNDFRTVELSYLQLVGTYLTAVNQLSLAVGREVLQ